MIDGAVISRYTEKYFILNVFLTVNLAQCVLLQCCVVLLQSNYFMVLCRVVCG